MRAECRLATPDREHKLTLHAELALDLGEPLGVLRLQSLALSGEVGEEGGVEVLGGRSGELCLPLHLGLARQHKIGKREIGLDAAQGLVEGGAADAGLLSVGPERVEEAAEVVGRLGLDGNRDESGGQKPEQNRDGARRRSHPNARAKNACSQNSPKTPSCELVCV